MAAEINIREATAEDAEALAAIYAPYVRNTAISFELEPPTPEEFATRISRTLERYPHFVAEHEGEIAGYAYAGAFKERAAYAKSVELSIYIDRKRRGKGIGRALYAALESELGQRGVTNLYACIAYPCVEDEYLTRDSVSFHEHMGFTIVGRFHECASKFGREYDMVWMEKVI